MSMEEDRRGQLYVPRAFAMAASIHAVRAVYPAYPERRREPRRESRIEPQREPERRSKEPILIDSPKRLKIAVSLTKQTTEAVSNRMKIDAPLLAIGGRKNQAPGRRQVLPSRGFGCIK
jgi:hypothetical protein